jgi:hypothetical protein
MFSTPVVLAAVVGSGVAALVYFLMARTIRRREDAASAQQSASIPAHRLPIKRQRQENAS